MKNKIFLIIANFVAILGIAACVSPQASVQEADEAAYQIIAEEHRQLLGQSVPFSIEPAAETLRTRLLRGQNLPTSSPAAQGSAAAPKVPHWPALDGAQEPGEKLFLTFPWQGEEPLKISLVDALQIGARNNRDFQGRKEEIFRAALDLDLERQEFRHTFSGLLSTMLSSDLSGDHTVSGIEGKTSATWGKRLSSGLELTSRLGLDLVKLLTLDKSSSLGIFADASISIPLLRGAGSYIVSEPLTQAQRQVIYAIYRFERFKKLYAVQVAKDYLAVLQRRDEVANTEANYKNLQISADRVMRLAEAGRVPEIEVDQTVQNVLRARDRWLQTQQAHSRQLDILKMQIGLPPDSSIALDLGEIELLAGSGQAEKGGGEPLTISEEEAIRLAFSHRSDLRIAEGQVHDGQRRVVVAADGLLPEATILASAAMGGGRTLASVDQPNAKLRPERGSYSALLDIDLPFERTEERNRFRASLIDLEEAVRDLQEVEDRIKVDVRDRRRTLLELRERVAIQEKASNVAQKRVASTNLFLEAGRVHMRDVLEAQESLVQAQNSLSAARVNQRIAELELQRDMGVLHVNNKGIWQEYAGLGMEGKE